MDNNVQKMILMDFFIFILDGENTDYRVIEELRFAAEAAVAMCERNKFPRCCVRCIALETLMDLFIRRFSECLEK
jgi:hypothetical protein